MMSVVILKEYSQPMHKHALKRPLPQALFPAPFGRRFLTERKSDRQTVFKLFFILLFFSTTTEADQIFEERKKT